MAVDRQAENSVCVFGDCPVMRLTIIMMMMMIIIMVVMALSPMTMIRDTLRFPTILLVVGRSPVGFCLYS